MVTTKIKVILWLQVVFIRKVVLYTIAKGTSFRERKNIFYERKLFPVILKINVCFFLYFVIFDNFCNAGD